MTEDEVKDPQWQWLWPQGEQGLMGERDWRRILIGEAVYRSALPQLLELLPLLEHVDPKDSIQIEDALTGIVYEVAGVAGDLGSAIHQLQVTPETGHQADAEAKLQEVVRALVEGRDSRAAILDGGVVAQRQETLGQVLDQRAAARGKPAA